MNPINYEVLDLIKEWVSSEDWKQDPNISFNEELKAFSVNYDAEWYPEDDSEIEIEEDDEWADMFYSFLIRVYIWDDKSFKIEFDEGLFHLMYKGYETDNERKAWEEFKSLTKERGLLFEG